MGRKATRLITQPRDASFAGTARIGLRSDLGAPHRASHNPSDLSMKILVPVDGSPASLRAVKLAIELAAGRQQTTIVLLNEQYVCS